MLRLPLWVKRTAFDIVLASPDAEGAGKGLVLRPFGLPNGVRVRWLKLPTLSVLLPSVRRGSLLELGEQFGAQLGDLRVDVLLGDAVLLELLAQRQAFYLDGALGLVREDVGVGRAREQRWPGARQVRRAPVRGLTGTKYRDTVK